MWGRWGWNLHRGCGSKLSIACWECTLQFKYGKWGSGRPSLPPADGKQNQGFFVPGALSFKWEWGPFLLIWLCISTVFQPRRQRQWICTLIHSMPSYGIRGKKNVLVITHYSYSDTEPVGPCHHIFQEILRDPLPSQHKCKCLGACNRKS